MNVAVTSHKFFRTIVFQRIGPISSITAMSVSQFYYVDPDVDKPARLDSSVH